MKKLITLLLVLCGGISQASGKTIYLVNNWNKSSLKIHLFGGSSGDTSWPGNSLSVSSTVDKYDCYTLDLSDYSKFIINYDDSGDGNTQTHTLLSSDYTDGAYYEFLWKDGSGLGEEVGKNTELKAITLYDYTLNITTATSWGTFNIWAWNYDEGTSTTTNVISNPWPGKTITGTANVYSYTHKSYFPNLFFIFNDGSNQTCNLTATAGSNNYYISTVTSSKVSDSDDTRGLSVKTNSYGYTTFKNYTAVSLTSGFAYYATDQNNGSAAAHYLSGNIAANTPMLIKGEPNTTYIFAITTETGTDYSSTNAFKAGNGGAVSSYDNAEAPTQYRYILNGDKFYRANGKTVDWNKAYLQLSQEASSASRILIFDEDGEATGIRLLDYEQQTGDDCYNLQGIKVASPTKGVYLRNGKKFIVK